MKTPTTRFRLLALLALFGLILLAKQPLHARAQRLEPTPNAPTPVACIAGPVVLAAPATAAASAPSVCLGTPIDFDLAAANEVVGNSYLFLADYVYAPADRTALDVDSPAARFDEVLPMWAPESVQVVSVARSADYMPYRVTVRSNISGTEGYFEVSSLSQLNRFLLMASPSRLSTAGS